MIDGRLVDGRLARKQPCAEIGRQRGYERTAPKIYDVTVLFTDGRSSIF